MAYNIVAERDNETVRMRRNSSIIAIAKARVWASEGWDVTIIDDDENPLVPGDVFADLKLPPAVKLTVPRSGGHLGFIGGKKGDPDRRWMDWRVVEWVTG